MYHKAFGSLTPGKLIRAHRQNKLLPDYEWFLREVSQHTNPIPIVVHNSFLVDTKDGEMTVVELSSSDEALIMISDPTKDIILLSRVNNRFVFFWKERYWMEAEADFYTSEVHTGKKKLAGRNWAVSSRYSSEYERFTQASVVVIYEVKPERKEDERQQHSNDGTYDWLEADTT